MKKNYSAPKLIPIGDMANNTLGSSGTQADGGSKQPGIYGDSRKSNSSSRSSSQRTFDNSAFDKSAFDKK